MLTFGPAGHIPGGSFAASSTLPGATGPSRGGGFTIVRFRRDRTVVLQAARWRLGVLNAVAFFPLVFAFMFALWSHRTDLVILVIATWAIIGSLLLMTRRRIVIKEGAGHLASTRRRRVIASSDVARLVVYDNQFDEEEPPWEVQVWIVLQDDEEVCIHRAPGGREGVKECLAIGRELARRCKVELDALIDPESDDDAPAPTSPMPHS